MVGNDIVDLNLSKTASNWQRPGWIQKLFCDEEQHHIKACSCPETLIWLYWSMKEAAYKIYNRTTGIRHFAPSKFQCSIENMSNKNANGYVTYLGQIYYTVSDIRTDYIHTIATTTGNKTGLTILISDNSKGQHLLNSPWHLHKDSRQLPYIVNTFTGKEYMASKSHHGNMEAIVF